MTSNPAPADLLRQLRADLGLTQAELALRANIDRTLISRYESGQRISDGSAYKLWQVTKATRKSPTVTVERWRR